MAWVTFPVRKVTRGRNAQGGTRVAERMDARERPAERASSFSKPHEVRDELFKGIKHNVRTAHVT